MSEDEARLLEIGNHTFKLTHNLITNTYKSEPLPSPTDAPIPIVGQGRILGIFQSESIPGKEYYVILSPNGDIYCTCMGFRAPNHCWHYRGMMDVLKEIPIGQITEPIRVGFNKKE